MSPTGRCDTVSPGLSSLMTFPKPPQVSQLGTFWGRAGITMGITALPSTFRAVGERSLVTDPLKLGRTTVLRPPMWKAVDCQRV